MDWTTDSRRASPCIRAPTPLHRMNSMGVWRPDRNWPLWMFQMIRRCTSHLWPRQWAVPPPRKLQPQSSAPHPSSTTTEKCKGSSNTIRNRIASSICLTSLLEPHSRAHKIWKGSSRQFNPYIPLPRHNWTLRSKANPKRESLQGHSSTQKELYSSSRKQLWTARWTVCRWRRSRCSAPADRLSNQSHRKRWARHSRSPKNEAVSIDHNRAQLLCKSNLQMSPAECLLSATWATIR